MFHIPIIKTNDDNRILEFSHINEYANINKWIKEQSFSFQSIKINIFMEGEFVIYVDNQSYMPMYGDVCVLTPYKIHCGHIFKKTKTNYFQLDIGTYAFEAAPNGMELLNSMVNIINNYGAFFRPNPENAKKLIDICTEIEDCIIRNNLTLAYAKAIEFVTLFCDMHPHRSNGQIFLLSPTTKKIIEFITLNFDKKITISSLAAYCNISPSYASRIFQKEVGMGIHEYLTIYRTKKAAFLLHKHSITEVCYMCGFADCSHFISIFKKHFKCTPKQYKRKISLEKRIPKRHGNIESSIPFDF